ncbi:hypothetical protein RUM43_009263 [Polyplax serrata]|uniref:alkaline phosphatase n=1 Tax=Polyplax serrata TaxID=468196 RepID=A0AAN8NQ26_POLSC
MALFKSCSRQHWLDDYVHGLFAYSHMDFETDRDTGPEGDPSLADMTRTALNVLQKSSKGFFLFVEDHVNFSAEILQQQKFRGKMFDSKAMSNATFKSNRKEF